MPVRRLAVLALVLSATAARAQDVDSGPAKGAKVPPLKVYAVSGPHKEKEVDYAADRKEQPTIYIFVQGSKFDRPVHRFIFTLDKALAKDFEKVHPVAVWLTDNQDATKERLGVIKQYYEATALTCFPGAPEGPKDWGINADAHVTVVLANKARVAARFGYNSINETNVREVVAALRKALDAK